MSANHEVILEELHAKHSGISQTKAFARSYIWWPGMDAAIESMVQKCAVCQSVKNTPAVAPLHPWPWPTRIWQRIHIDFAEKDGVNYLIVVDSHSKWLEVVPMRSTTANKTIDVLRGLFAFRGLSEEVVSDNGPQFTAHEFKTFMEVNGIKHTRVALCSNSEAGFSKTLCRNPHFERTLACELLVAISLPATLRTWNVSGGTIPKTQITK